MSREKQIEEMAEYIYGNGITHDTAFHEDCRSIARDLYNAGYRKQSEGEWVLVQDKSAYGDNYFICSVCEGKCHSNEFGFCPNCGAKMFVRMTHTCPHNIPNLIPTIEEMKGGAE